jgi:predicted nucleotidyltransferase
VLDRFASELTGRLGDELHAVWLFGSRARGERSAGEDSDVDVPVLVDDASLDGEQRVHAALDESVGALDLEDLAAYFSVHIGTPEWLAQRRAIQSFFIAEVDREKVVVASRGMSPRSAEFLEAARRPLGAATGAVDNDPSTAVSAAYYSMLCATRAALSERDVHAKTPRRNLERVPALIRGDVRVRPGPGRRSPEDPAET